MDLIFPTYNYTTWEFVAYKMWNKLKRLGTNRIGPNFSVIISTNSNVDFNLSFNKIILGSNIDTGFAIQAGFSYKNSFEYPRIFNLLLLPKIDAEDLDKKIEAALSEDLTK